MLRTAWPLAVLVALAVVPCFAQDASFDARRDLRPSPGVQEPSTNAQLTTEMWLYEQERSRYEDPAQAVRRKAELRGMQRSQRLASMKWFGLSNSRPLYTNATPSLGGFGSAQWGSNSYDVNRWRPYYYPNAAVEGGSRVRY